MVPGPGGQRHYYARLDSYGDVHPGMRIDAGKIVGYVGNTGNAITTPPHLHYGIYTAGGAINPYPFLHSYKRTGDDGLAGGSGARRTTIVQTYP